MPERMELSVIHICMLGAVLGDAEQGRAPLSTAVMTVWGPVSYTHLEEQERGGEQPDGPLEGDAEPEHGYQHHEDGRMIPVMTEAIPLPLSLIHI